MVWDCFFVMVRANSTAYNDILDDSVLQTLAKSVGKNFIAVHRALTSTPSNTFGMSWNTHCEPGVINQHPCLTSLMEWKQVPAGRFQHHEKLSQKSGGCYSRSNSFDEMLDEQGNT
jgi:hypothetical protein